MTRPVSPRSPFPDLSLTRRGLMGGAAALGAGLLMPRRGRAQDDLIRTHGYSYYGDLHYPAGFEHFTYVNPDAPVGGEISEYASGTFDSMNP
ncbi:MAG: hypothetical protein KDK12_08460, partial [Rhodobacteraceae bacterium]|nr:hypothetical protein [Paracoccaceae bacterium]